MEITVKLKINESRVLSLMAPDEPTLDSDQLVKAMLADGFTERLNRHLEISAEMFLYEEAKKQ